MMIAACVSNPCLERSYCSTHKVFSRCKHCPPCLVHYDGFFRQYPDESMMLEYLLSLQDNSACDHIHLQKEVA